MLIQCPECGFDRQIDPSHIPDTAVMATCPRCNRRFRFRDRPDGDEPQPESRVLPAPAADAADDPLPPGAITPSLPTDEDDRDQAASRSEFLSRYKRQAGPFEPDDDRPEPPEPLEPASARDPRSLFQGGGSSSIPWEASLPRDLPLALYHTLLQALFAIPAFFAEVGRSRASLLRPCLFYVLIGLFQGLMQRFWFLTKLGQQLEAMPDSQAVLDAVAQSMSVPLLLVTAPPLLLVQLLIYGALFHVMIRIIQPDRADLSTSIRVVAYSAAPGIFSIVPFIGLTVASVWFSLSCFMGLKFALNLTWQRTAMAVLPLYMLAILISLHVNRMLAEMLAAA